VRTLVSDEVLIFSRDFEILFSREEKSCRRAESAHADRSGKIGFLTRELSCKFPSSAGYVSLKARRGPTHYDRLPTRATLRMNAGSRMSRHPSPQPSPTRGEGEFDCGHWAQ